MSHKSRKARRKNEARRKKAAEKNRPLDDLSQWARAVDRQAGRVRDWNAFGYATVTYKER